MQNVFGKAGGPRRKYLKKPEKPPRSNIEKERLKSLGTEKIIWKVIHHEGGEKPLSYEGKGKDRKIGA